MTYNAKDIYLERSTGNKSFEEYPLRSRPDCVVVTDTTGSISLVSTASFLQTTSSNVSSSYALSASYASNSPTQLPDITDFNDSGVYIGIGQPSPQYTLDVNGVIGDSVSHNYFISNNSYPTIFNAFGGNVGIGLGVRAPINTLEVGGNISASVITASLFFGTASVATSASYAPGGGSQWVSTGSNITFNGGNVGIGVQDSDVTLTVAAGNPAIIRIRETNNYSGGGGTPAGIILFSCVDNVVGDFVDQAYIFAQKDPNADSSTHGGRFSIFTRLPNNGSAERMSIDRNGITTFSGSVRAVDPDWSNTNSGFIGNLEGTASMATTASAINGTSDGNAPINQTTASAWMPVTVDGQTYYIPLYQ